MEFFKKTLYVLFVLVFICGCRDSSDDSFLITKTVNIIGHSQVYLDSRGRPGDFVVYETAGNQNLVVGEYTYCRSWRESCSGVNNVSYTIIKDGLATVTYDLDEMDASSRPVLIRLIALTWECDRPTIVLPCPTPSTNSNSNCP